MNDFHQALTYVNKMLYEPSGLVLSSIQEEKQNAIYGAGTFRLSSRSIRFRVAQTTPTKVGQFVTIWEKDENNKNQPYSYEHSPEFLVITTFKNNQHFGQFIFPKDILLEKNILSSKSKKGKMAIRVYPSWDKPKSKQAMKTQEWQLAYFIDIDEHQSLQTDKIKKYYYS